MVRVRWFFLLISISLVVGTPNFYETQNFKIGIEYEHSLPMYGGSDRFRHRNNYDPFFVTVSTSAKNGFVISYLEVSATVDAIGEVEFHLVRGQTGSRTMTFQLVSNHSDFLSYYYLAYGIREEEYRKISNIITVPIASNDIRLQYNVLLIILPVIIYLIYSLIYNN